MPTPENNPLVSFTGRDFQMLLSNLQEYVSVTNPTAWSDFTQSNVGMNLISLLAYVGDMLSFGQDQVAREVFLSTCSRYDSALRFANSVGYTPRGAEAAQAQLLNVGPLPTTLTTYGGTIPKGTSIAGLNGLNYELQAAYTVNAGDTAVRFTMLDGTTYTEDFTPSTQQNQTITTANGVVQDASWQVFVGDPTNPSNEWTQVDNVNNETSPTNSYSITLNSTGQLVVSFGDGTAGAIPAETVTIIYRTCDGAAGNCPAGGITGNVQATLNSPGVGTVSVAMTNLDNSSQATGGTQLVTAEAEGLTINSVTQSATTAQTPILTGSLSVTIILPASGGMIVLQDNGSGGFSVTTNTSSFTLSSSAVTYATGAWSATFNSALPAGGTITASYYEVVATVGAGQIVGAAVGGEDRESLAELKVNIPAFIRSQGKIITLQDYQDNLPQVPGVALSAVERYVSSYTANMVRISAWGESEVSFQSEDSSGNLDAPTTYTQYAEIQPVQIAAIQAFLTPRTILSIGNVILQPGILWADVYLGTVTYDGSQAAANVRAAIAQAVVGVFEASSGFQVRLSDIFKAVAAAQGVEYFAIQRVATGEDSASTSDELQGTTTASTAVAGTLLAPTASPGTVEITINQTSSLTVTLQDNGAGAFVVTGGTLVLSASSINYHTGAWSATFTTTLIASQQVFAAYNNVLDDYRQAQVVTIGAVSGGDQWPPVNIAETAPVSTPPYKDGVPLSALRSGSPVSYPYALGDVLTYNLMQDIVAPSGQSGFHQYNNAYLFNNEIYYDSVYNTTSDLLAINLRRLVFDLVPA